MGRAALVPLSLVSSSACRGPRSPLPSAGWAMQPAPAQESGSGGHFWPEHFGQGAVHLVFFSSAEDAGNAGDTLGTQSVLCICSSKFICKRLRLREDSPHWVAAQCQALPCYDDTSEQPTVTPVTRPHGQGGRHQL